MIKANHPAELNAMPAGRITTMAFRSLGNFFQLALRGLLHMQKERHGFACEIDGKGKFEAFGETVNAGCIEEGPVVMIVGFRLKHLGYNSLLHSVFQHICVITTPFWSGLPGFHIKLWMVDPETKNYAGIYEWMGKEKAGEYISALIPVLNFFSVQGSVWHSFHNGQQMEALLNDASTIGSLNDTTAAEVPKEPEAIKAPLL